MTNLVRIIYPNAKPGLRPPADYKPSPSGRAAEWFSATLPEPTEEQYQEATRSLLKPLTARQLRLWLLGAGLSPSAVDAQIAAIPDASAREAARIEWEYSTAYHRTHPLVIQLGAALGLTAEQIDAAFIAAAKI